MTGRLPAAVIALVRAILSARLADEYLADLADEYRRVCERRPAPAAVLWLGREVVALLGAAAGRAAGAAGTSVPHVVRDVRQIARSLRQAPMAISAAVATLAVGLAGVALAAALTQVVLRRPVSSVHRETLVRVAVADAAGQVAVRLAHVEVERIREHLAGRAACTAVNLQPAVLRADGADVHTMVEVVDGRFFELTAPPIVLGRGLIAGDDRSAAPPVAVIGQAVWRRHFAADPAVIGRTVTINRASFTVVGVSAAPGAASAFGAGVDAWTPLAHADAVLSAGWRADPEARWFTLFAVPAGTIADVEADLALATRDLAARDPKRWQARRLHVSPGTVLAGGQRAGTRSLLLVLAGLAVLILAAGAANLAGVLMAGVPASARQAAIHLALGAGRLVLARRLLLEGFLIGVVAGVLALGLYAWARWWIADVALLPTLSLRIDLPLDPRTGGAVVALAAAIGVTLALAPARAMTGAGALAAVAHASREAGGAAVSRARRGLVATQTAISLVLVVGAMLFLRTATSLAAMDLGFARQGLVAMDFDLAPAVAQPAAAALARTALARIGALPGVTGVAMASRAPVDRSLPTVGLVGDDGGAELRTTQTRITESYFDTVGIPLVAGRPFTRAEADRDDPVVVVDEPLSRRLWPDGDALGRSFLLGAERQRVRVVGVARRARQRSVTDPGVGHVYRPVAAGFSLTLLARTEVDSRRTLTAIQRVLDDIGPGVVGFFPRTLDDHLATELLPVRLAAGATSVLALIALLLSGCGLYGLVASLVDRRRREIGVRLALGASPAGIVRLVVGEAMGMAAPGAIGGALIAAALSVWSRSQFVGVGPLDPAAFAVGAAAVSVVVVVAAWAPGARASRVDPALVLRDL